MDIPKTYRDIPVVRFRTVEDWCAWLDKNHAAVPTGVWMLVLKKSSDQWGLDYAATREGALRYGWIDSLPNKLDDDYYYLKVTPRRPKSIWSKINVALVEQYIAEGKMHPAGLAEAEAAKADGRWQAAY